MVNQKHYKLFNFSKPTSPIPWRAYLNEVSCAVGSFGGFVIFNECPLSYTIRTNWTAWEAYLSPFGLVTCFSLEVEGKDELFSLWTPLSQSLTVFLVHFWMISCEHCEFCVDKFSFICKQYKPTQNQPKVIKSTVFHYLTEKKIGGLGEESTEL